jgi:hypothetical protein
MVSNLAVDNPTKGRGESAPSESAPRMMSSGIFICSAASITFALLRAPTHLGVAGIVATAGVVFFLVAFILAWSRPGAGYILGIFAGVAALPWFVLTEMSSAPMNSWVALNGPDGLFPGQAELTAIARLRILSIALIVVAIVSSSIRLLPAALLLGNRPLYLLTWPAFFVSALALIPWFMHSAVPYRTPIIADGVRPELRIVHAEKRGLRIHEAGLSLFKDGKVYVSRDDRRLFQYRFQTQDSVCVISPALLERVKIAMSVAELSKAGTKHTWTLQSWNADGWYVAPAGSQFIAFTSEDRLKPPHEVSELFDELLKMPLVNERSYSVSDICLGFCYSLIEE